MKYRCKIQILVSCFCGFLSFSQAQDYFSQATENYSKGDYLKALQDYKSIIKLDQHSPELYYNMGNTYYKLDSIPQCIFYYEKSLKLEPNNEDVRYNLKIARQRIIDIIEPLPQGFFSKIIGIMDLLTYNSYALLGVIFMMIFGLLFLIYYFSSRVILKKISFLTSMTFLFLSVLSTGFAYNRYGVFKNTKYAIIFSDVTDIKSEPNLSSSPIFQLHEGSKVQVINTFGDWYEIKLANANTGWVLNNNLKIY